MARTGFWMFLDWCSVWGQAIYSTWLIYLFQLGGSSDLFVKSTKACPVQCMQDEMKKRQPNTSRIADKMKRTSEYRQRFCRVKTTAKALQEFPCLRITGFVSIIILNKFCCYFPNTRKIIICLLLWCSVLTRLIVCVSCKSKLTNRWLALHDALS